MQFRIGVNLGDVIEEADGTIYGDGVNIAARMESLAEGGGICISSTVYDAIEGKLSCGFDFLGEQQVKNIAKPVRVHASAPSQDHRCKSRPTISSYAHAQPYNGIGPAKHSALEDKRCSKPSRLTRQTRKRAASWPGWVSWAGFSV